MKGWHLVEITLFWVIQIKIFGVFIPRAVKGLKFAITEAIIHHFNIPIKEARCMRKGGGGNVSPRTVISGYFSWIIEAYCSKTRL